MAHWDKVEALAVNGGHWTHLDEALWLVCRGLTLEQAADVVSTHRSNLQRKISKIRDGREPTPAWLIHMRDIRQQRRNPQI